MYLVPKVRFSKGHKLRVKGLSVGQGESKYFILISSMESSRSLVAGVYGRQNSSYLFRAAMDPGQPRYSWNIKLNQGQHILCAVRRLSRAEARLFVDCVSCI